MPKVIVNPPWLPKPSGYSHGIEAQGRMIFVAGQTALDTDGRIAPVGDLVVQFRQALANVGGAPISTAAVPFSASRRRVSAASGLLPVRSTLVAPMLPDPMLRTSPCPASLVRMRPKGMEPST